MKNQEIRVGKIALQASVIFMDAEITAVKNAEDGLIYGSVPHLSRAIGLDLQDQRERIENHAVLTQGACLFEVVTHGRIITTLCLKVNLVPLWLTLIDVNRVRSSEKRERILQFQLLVADVLSRLFGSEQPVDTTALITEDPPYAEGLAIARMANEQAIIELAQKVSNVETDFHTRLNAIEATMGARILALETKLMPGEQISEEQASLIMDLVKQAGITLAQKMGGGNYIGTIYGQLYKLFRITSYKNLTQAQYPKAVDWLEKQINENRGTKLS